MAGAWLCSRWLLVVYRQIFGSSTELFRHFCSTLLSMDGMRIEFLEALASFRKQRRFDPSFYIEEKCSRLNKYLAESGISAVVVGVSGGIDSAITLGLVKRATTMAGSPIRRVVAALIPLFVSEGATHQEEALSRGREVAASFDAECAVADLSDGFDRIRHSVEDALSISGRPWARGQLVSYIRTPALYYFATLLAEQGSRAVVCGTTNRDEGSYIGFFGKASDGMVDIQLISDIHKSEVRSVAAAIGVPDSSIRAIPTGDTFDGRSDEEMVGVPYDFLELYEHYLCLNEPHAKLAMRHGWSNAAQERFDEWSAKLEKLHSQNLHKYLGESPAVHLDIYERAVPGGWSART